MERLMYLNDSCRQNDAFTISNPQRINSKVEFFNDITGERIWEPLHNKTVIAGAALTMMKLFNLDRSVLDNTPTYDSVMDLDEKASASDYPAIVIPDANGNVIGSIPDETQRIICGFCVGIGGSGSDTSDVFNVPYASWIMPDNMVPFRYPLESADNVDENMYKGKKRIALDNGDVVNAYYFKSFSNTPQLVQNYVSTIGTATDVISQDTVYSNAASADKAQSYVELHLKITKDDCREFFTRSTGLENARINQISLVTAWTKTVTVEKLDAAGNTTRASYEYLQDIRPFSVINIPSEILSTQKSISCIYTLYA